MQQLQDMSPMISELEALIYKLEQELVLLPEGFLRIDHSRKLPRYYWCNSKRPNEPKSGFYLSLNEKEQIILLAKKSFYKKNLRYAKKLLYELKSSRVVEWKQILENLYYDLPEDRQALLSPIFPSDEDYALQWKRTPYQTKGGFSDGWNIMNSKGEYMRSKSEALIADLLNEYGIPYRYEPVVIFSRNLIFHPDFQILNKRTRKEYYWEHFGMMGMDQYLTKALGKIDIYAQHGFVQGENIIYTFESESKGLNMNLCRITIENFFL